MVMCLDGLLHHFLDRVSAQIAGRDDQQPHGVGDQVQQVVVFEQGRVFTKNSAGFGVFDVRLQRHRPLTLERFHDLGDHENRVQVVVFFVFRAFEDLTKAAQSAFDNVHAVAHQHGGNRSAANDEGLDRCGLDDGRHAAAGHDEATEHTDKQDHQTDSTDH